MDTQRRPLLRGEAAVRLRGGVCDGRSKATKRIGKTDHLQRCHEAIYPLGIFRQAETQHGAVGFGPEQAQGELAVGMAFKAWMIDLFDEGVGFKGGGKLIVIDGGFCRAYHKETGIAGYTLIYNSYGLSLTAHEPFESTEKAIQEEKDIVSRQVAVRYNMKRQLVGDTDQGRQIRQRIRELKELIEAYRTAQLKELL